MTPSEHALPGPQPPDRRDYITGLRALADLLDSNRDVPLPDVRYVQWDVWETPSTVADVTAIIKAIPGDWVLDQAKVFSSLGAAVFRAKIAGLEVEVWAYRDLVGTTYMVGTRDDTIPYPDPGNTDCLRWEHRKVPVWDVHLHAPLDRLVRREQA